MSMQVIRFLSLVEVHPSDIVLKEMVSLDL